MPERAVVDRAITQGRSFREKPTNIVQMSDLDSTTNWTADDTALRDDIRRRLVMYWKALRTNYGDRITDNALWLANKDYSAMRTAERNKHDL